MEPAILSLVAQCFNRLRNLVLRADNLANLMCRLSENPGSLNFLEPLGPL